VGAPRFGKRADGEVGVEKVRQTDAVGFRR
jgi:hypothetical protein